jgi:hypothetical protein
LSPPDNAASLVHADSSRSASDMPDDRTHSAVLVRMLVRLRFPGHGSIGCPRRGIAEHPVGRCANEACRPDPSRFTDVLAFEGLEQRSQLSLVDAARLGATAPGRSRTLGGRDALPVPN